MEYDIVQIERDERRLCSCFAFVVFCLFLTNLSGGLESLIGIPAEITSWALKLLILIRLVLCVDSILHRMDAKLICVIVAQCVFFLLNAVCFRENLRHMTGTLSTFIITCFPMFVLAYMVNDFDVLKRSLIKYSRIIGAVSSLMFIFLITNLIPSFNEDKYSMGYGYALLIPMLILLVNSLEAKKLYDIALCAVMFMSILALGSRGPLLVVAVFVMLFYARKGFKQFIAVLLLTVVFAACYEEILLFLLDLTEKWGFSSRTLQMLAEGRGAAYSSRAGLYNFILEQVRQSPLALRGINAEYVYEGVYAHNLFLELIYQFGIIVGGMMCIALIWMAFKELFFRNNSITFLYMCVSLVHLMVSSSLWINITFWCWLGFCLKNANNVDEGSVILNEETSDCR